MNNNENEVEKNQQTIESYKNQISSQDFRLVKIRAALETMEKNLGKKNQVLLKNLSRMKLIKNEIAELKQSINDNQANIQALSVKMKGTVNFVIVNNISGITGPSTLASSKILIKTYQKQLEQLREQNKVSQLYQERLLQYEKGLKNLEFVGNELRNVIGELEQRKRNLADSYLEINQNKNELESLLDGIRYKIKKEHSLVKKKQDDQDARLIPVGNNDLRFGKLRPPIESFSSINYENKGVTFKYNKSTKVLAVGKGKVIYAGNLASYGNVIMLEHGNELRSLILGGVVPEVKKGEEVIAGQVIAHTKVSPNADENTLYFEVRQKNIAQNTFLWFDKNIVASNF